MNQNYCKGEIQMRKRGLWTMAMLTLETALIFPIVLFSIIGCVFYSFYLHDIIVVKSRIYSIDVKNSDFKQTICKDLLISKLGKIDVNTKGHEIQTEIEMKVEVLGAGFNQKLIISGTVMNYDYCEEMRKNSIKNILD